MSSDKSFVISSTSEISIQLEPMKKHMNADQTTVNINTHPDSQIKTNKYRNGVLQLMGNLKLKVNQMNLSFVQIDAL